MFYFKLDDSSELRLFEEYHARDLFLVVDSNRSHLRQWLPWVDMTRRIEDSLDFIRTGRKQYADNLGFHAGIWVEGELAGVIGLHRINWANRRTGIGYWLAEGYQGRGLVTRACRVVLDYIFYDLGLNRAEIHCGADNIKSQAIPERLGFTREGMVRQAEWVNDHFVDHVAFGLLASEWDRQES